MGHYAAEMACPQCHHSRCRCPAPAPNPWKGWILHGEGARPLSVKAYAQQRSGDPRGMIEWSLMSKTIYETEAAAHEGRQAYLKTLIGKAEARLEYLRSLLAESANG